MDGNRRNEVIYAAGKVYTSDGRRWSPSKLTLQQVMDLDEKNRPEQQDDLPVSAR
jgi:hypothetical protein